MPREIVTVQVGQCGNQIGLRFWDLALQEHSAYNKSLIYDEALSSFFRNVDSRKQGCIDLQPGTQINDLKARAIIVDMESGVIDKKILGGELKDIFDSRQTITDQVGTGSGNNWAQGHMEYGPKYQEEIEERVRQQVEKCDSLQGFFFLHSLGGGTGSGLGSYILKDLADLYPSVFKFSTCVFPSNDDDVITSPYNSMLALNCLIDAADCILPVDNQALFDIVSRCDQQYEKVKQSKNMFGKDEGLKNQIKEGTSIMEAGNKKKKANHFEKENAIVANVINNMTCSMRFEGDLNVDMNEITMNLVPFPKLHFLQSSLSPLFNIINPKLQPRNIDQSFADLFDRQNSLIQQSAECQSSLILATGIIVRGNKIEISDINRNIERLTKKLNMVHWNQEGFKVGHCYQAPLNQSYAVLALNNSTSTRHILTSLKRRFLKIYKQKVFVHHYEQFMGADYLDHFQHCLENCESIIKAYESMEVQQSGPNQQDCTTDEFIDSYRFKPLI